MRRSKPDAGAALDEPACTRVALELLARLFPLGDLGDDRTDAEHDASGRPDREVAAEEAPRMCVDPCRRLEVQVDQRLPGLEHAPQHRLQFMTAAQDQTGRGNHAECTLTAR